MRCPRCHGSMVPDIFEDIGDDTGSCSFSGWRCLPYGEILDPAITRNRRFRREPLLGRARKKFATRLR